MNFKILTAAGAAAAALVAGPASAGLVTITGVSATQFSYGTALNKNNVVNAPGSGLTDATSTVNEWYVQSTTILSDVRYTSSTAVMAEWWYSGAESGNKNKFEAFGTPNLTKTEGNENNNYNFGNDPGFSVIGSQILAAGSSALIPFKFTDINQSKSVANGGNAPPGPRAGSLTFAYVNPTYSGTILTGWAVTASKSDWFAVGFDDPGSTNDDHDDMMVVGHITAVPIPAAAWLFGSAILGLVGVGRRKLLGTEA